MARENRQYRKRSRSASSESDSNKKSSRKRSRSRSKGRSRSRERDRKRSRSRDRERNRDRGRDRDRSRRSRSRSYERQRRRNLPQTTFIRRSRSKDRSRRRRSRSRSKDRYQNSRSYDRRRSRSPRRDRRSRSRNRDRDRRSMSPNKDRNRSRKSPSKGRDKSQEKDKSTKKDDLVKEESFTVKEEKDDDKGMMLEQKRLEEIIQKRKERIEKWRFEQKKSIDVKKEILNIIPSSKKKWSLEDDADDEEEDEQVTEENQNEKEGEKSIKIKEEKEDEKEVKKEEKDDDIDPLDAFMQGVQDEVRKITNTDRSQKGLPAMEEKEDMPLGTVSIVTGVAKKLQVPHTSKILNKGELMINDQDAMEYSSEEEETSLADTMKNALELKKKKELALVDHTTIDYQPFRKDFYIEVPQLAKMTAEDVEALRESMESIKVRGKNVPKPIKEWVQCGVSKKILDVLKKNKYEKPTPIQAQAIPSIMSGRDLIGIAKTGSGKTMAFLIPMMRHILDQDPLEADEGPISMILTPTRELAMQIYKECKKFTKSHGLKAVCVYGGTGISEQIAELKRGAEIIVCTPGRMIDMLAANNGRVTNLRRCTYLVLDEADRMFDMGFEPQVMKIVDNIRPDRQTVLFSATFPRQMEALARRILTKPVEVQVGGRSIVCSDVEQHLIILEEEEQKFLKLLELLGIYQEKGSVLVFVERQESADRLLKDLMKSSYSCVSLHGGIDQYDRDSIIQDFKAGNVRLMVATSVAARGLDVKQLILVVNYDCPNHYEDYVHRCGRTGRAGNKGFAYTFISPDQSKFAGDIIKAFEVSGQKVPTELSDIWKQYVEDQKASGKEIQKNSGFSGKGFKFDETERELANEKKKLQKASYGLQDSDEEELGLDIDEKIETMFAAKKRVKDISAAEAAMGISKTVATDSTTGVSTVNQEKLEKAKRLAERINRNLEGDRHNVVQQATQAVLKGGIITAPTVSAKTIAEQLAEKLNAKLNYTPKIEEEVVEEQKETCKKYEEELQINDFPQTARWKVTSKENLAQIQDYSDAGITIRGTFIPPGKEPKEGERKLYLAIESISELSVQKAKAEIIRLIKDELIRLQNSYQPTNRGRYKVI
ncbi:probable ATP-dependent RNA helicase DDX46 [Antedon mediterranea]|uniref:probable ATP-dependent RNA helicase DDX46 n=1 Tax=Antedon mediterranea TaxID=105859 RepID=UPI003AF63AAF